MLSPTVNTEVYILTGKGANCTTFARCIPVHTKQFLFSSTEIISTTLGIDIRENALKWFQSTYIVHIFDHYKKDNLFVPVLCRL